MTTSMITTVTAMMSGVVVPSSAEQKHIIWHITRNKETQKHSSECNKTMVVVESKIMVYTLADSTNDFSMML